MSDHERDSTTLQARGSYEPCEECGAPLDAQQRYCVNCAARRGNGANPSSRYFAQVNKKTRQRLTGPAKKPAPTSRAAAVGFFALLPIAVAIGVVVGRSGSDNGNEEALLKALQSQESAVATSSESTPTASTSKAKGKKAAAKKTKAEKELEKDGGKVVAKTKNGTVHQITGYKPTPQKEAEDTKLVEENPEQVGENYIKAQQNLPDVTVVGGDGTGGPSTGGPEP